MTGLREGEGGRKGGKVGRGKGGGRKGGMIGLREGEELQIFW